MGFHGSVGTMTRCTTFHLQRGMLVNPRAAFLRMTTEARLKIYSSQLRAVQSSMGIMAIRTFHESFRNAMVRRQGKLGLNCPMAAKAEVRLFLLKQAFV